MTMAEAALLEKQPSVVLGANHSNNNNNNNNNNTTNTLNNNLVYQPQPLPATSDHFIGGKFRKRKRLSQVLDKLTGQSMPLTTTINNNIQHLNNNIKEEDANARFILRASMSTSSTDIFTNDRYQASEDEDVFSPAGSSNKSPHSSTDSPRISFSPLRLKEDETSSSPPLPPKPCPCYQCITGLNHHQANLHPYDRFFPASPISPLTPSSPAQPAYSFERYLHTKYLPDLFRRRSHSDSDLWFESTKPDRGRLNYLAWPHPLTISTAINPTTRGSLESDTLSPQDSPLDLSMKNRNRIVGSTDNIPLAVTQSYQPPRTTVSVPVIKGDVASPTTKESVASRYNLEVSPVVEEMPPGSDVAYVCPVCGQMFSLHDRLAKHMASRHKSRQTNSDTTTKAYLCEVCKRSFARSDMLTRHMRLHTGVKPYTCSTCGQVFSRSDHLSTHQRTHTGEKPYRCPQCPYAACRRDMITRHLRTHARYEPNNAATSGSAAVIDITSQTNLQQQQIIVKNEHS